MALEQTDATSPDKAGDAAVHPYHLELNEVLVDIQSARREMVDKYKAETEQRKADYQSGKERTSGSYAFLKQLPITIFDGDSTVVCDGMHPSEQDTVVEDLSGRVEKTVDATGKTRSFTYDPDGRLTGVTDENGVTWSTADGETWSSTDGRTWKGTISVERDGTYREVNEELKETIKKPDGTITVKEPNGRVTDTLPDGTTKVVQEPVDREKLTRLAEELNGRSDSIFGGTSLDKESNRRDMIWSGKAFDRLDRLNDAEREALKGIYHQKYGRTITEDYAFLEGKDKERFDKYFTSNDPLAAKADRLRTAIDKSREAYSWHSYLHTDRTNPNQEIRETLKSMNSEEIRQMDNYYRRVYGESLHDAIRSDTPETTREMCEIYLKGIDKRTVEDSQTLLRLQEEEKIKVDGVPDSKLQAEDVEELFDDNFTRLDKDKDGFVSEYEIDRAMKDSDYKGKDAQLVTLLKSKREELEELSNDENFDEDDGVTRKDIRELTKLAKKQEKSEDEQELVEDINGNLKSSGRALKQGSRNLWGVNSNPVDSIRPEAVRQRKVGDCPFMASLAGLANTPEGKEQIKNMIEDNGDGTYTVTFPGDPKHPVTIDEPTQAELCHGAAPTDDGIWVAVLEKAYGKRQAKQSDEHYTYTTDSIDDGGYGRDVMPLLTGKTVDHDDLSETSKETTHEKLTAAMREGRPVVASTAYEDEDSGDGYTDRSGVPTNHVFTVTGYDPETRMVTLRNPWGHGEPKFRARKLDDPNDGVFQMSLDDFHREFEDVDYAKSA
ncbi:MAG TPA: C2 family cysteine protease [Candidatus Obscuribacterales bacterium]